MSAFVDTSALLAVVHAEDEQHRAAAATWTQLLSSRERPWTSNYVVVESVSLIQHRYGVEAVCRFVMDVLPAMDVAWVESSVHDAALRVMCSSGRGGPSIVELHELRDHPQGRCQRGVRIRQPFPRTRVHSVGPVTGQEAT